jgi:hypothetical protein
MGLENPFWIDIAAILGMKLPAIMGCYFKESYCYWRKDLLMASNLLLPEAFSRRENKNIMELVLSRVQVLPSHPIQSLFLNFAQLLFFLEWEY